MKVKEILFELSNSEKRQVKQIEIAKLLGCSRQNISDLNKRNKDLSVDKIKIIEEHYGIDLSETLHMEEQLVRVIIPKNSKIKVIVEYE